MVRSPEAAGQLPGHRLLLQAGGWMLGRGIWVSLEATLSRVGQNRNSDPPQHGGLDSL